MKKTLQKTIILDTILSMQNHPTAEEVYHIVKEKNDGIGIATVYRNLNSFASKGLIRKVSVVNAPDRFDYRTDEHEHLLCDTCGRVFDAEVDVMINPKSESIKIDGYTLTLHGVCENCYTLTGRES